MKVIDASKYKTIKGIDLPELAWASGFISADGYFGITKLKDRRRESMGQVYTYTRPRLQVGQSSNDGIPDTLERLKNTFGGYIVGPYKGSGHAKKPVYRWSLHGYERVQAAAAALWKWLSKYRKEQAKKTLKAYQERGGTRD